MPAAAPWLAPYPHPVAAVEQATSLAERFSERCRVETIGQSAQGRPLLAFHVGLDSLGTLRPRLLVTAQIHGGEYIGGYVARALLQTLLEGSERDPMVASLGRRAVITVVPLLNPDGAEIVWQRRGWVGFKASRVTANRVDPNRNFPFAAIPGRRAWNSSSARKWSPYFRGPHPLSEPECLALARLCQRERFCAAVNFHSFGGVVFFPSTRDPRLDRIFDVFRSVFPAAQKHCRYRPVPEPISALSGQLDLFLLHAFGTASVTVEVSRPGWAMVARPHRWFHFFSWANPPNPTRWVENDVPATIAALAALLERTGGRAQLPRHPELGEQIPRQATLQALSRCS
ncbi:MAG: M14 family metallopeptidase [Candidatus Binatia bacterium]|nr:M14 family metallopeptidase [Candidatus Binatia bacterium]